MPTYTITKPYTIKSKPIIFNGEMVRAILEGRKTQTRRVIKSAERTSILAYKDCPHGQKGDFLWVRESIRKRDVGCANATHFGATYLADFTPVMGKGPHGGHYLGRAVVQWKWKRETLPSIFMPRWASRIILKITEIKVEQLQQISIEDIKAEGTDFHYDPGKAWHEVYRNRFTELWDSINAKRGYSWESNPWVWVIEFERIDEKDGDEEKTQRG